MKISYNHESIRLTGRWDTLNKNYATATATGSYIEFCFKGTQAIALFDCDNNKYPFPHLYIQLDNGDLVETMVDNYIRIISKEDKEHIVKIIFKGTVEEFRRWFSPLESKISFCGVITDTPVKITEDTRKTIEFVGDSITEGVLTDENYYGENGENKFSIGQFNRVYQDDVTATYAWLTAEKLNLRPIFMGYGAVGATRVGMGAVPKADEAYPYNFNESPITHKNCDYILINHGANDRFEVVENYLTNYEKLLDVIIKMNPDSKIISLSAFCGAFHNELGEFIKEYNKNNNTDIFFIDSNGWVPVEPLHPNREGHKVIAEKLAEILTEHFGIEQN
jgi:lysophospholipase L1-like esterase